MHSVWGFSALTSIKLTWKNVLHSDYPHDNPVSSTLMSTILCIILFINAKILVVIASRLRCRGTGLDLECHRGLNVDSMGKTGITYVSGWKHALHSTSSVSKEQSHRFNKENQLGSRPYVLWPAYLCSMGLSPCKGRNMVPSLSDYGPWMGTSISWVIERVDSRSWFHLAPILWETCLLRRCNVWPLTCLRPEM